MSKVKGGNPISYIHTVHTYREGEGDFPFLGKYVNNKCTETGHKDNK